MEEIQEIKNLLDKLEANYTAEHTSKIKHNLLLNKINTLINTKFPVSNIEEINYILSEISDILLIDISAMKSNKRHKDIVFARQIFFYYISMNYDITQARLASILNRDHATVIYSIRVVTEQKSYFFETLKELNKRVKLKIKN